MIIQLIAALVGTIAFSLLFGVPKQYYPYCGIIGMLGWGVYLLVASVAGSGIACLMGAMVVVFLSRLVAVRKKCPATIFLIAGIFPMVPGAGVYWTTYYLVTDQLWLAAQTGYTAVKNAIAIVLGIVFIFELPQKLFLFLGGLTEKEEEK